MGPIIYLHLEDDVRKVAQKLRLSPAERVVLAVPKKSLLFADPVNLLLLKKQAGILGKIILLFTLDEQGRDYAKQAGLSLVGEEEEVAEPDYEVSLPEPTPQPPVPEIVEIPRIMQQKPKRNLIKSPRIQSTTSSMVAPERFLQNGPKKSVSRRLTEDKHTQVRAFEKDSGTEKVGRGVKSVLIIFLVSAIVLVFALVGVILPSTEVTVMPRTEAFVQPADLTVVLDNSDRDPLTLPGKLIERTTTKTVSLSTEGKRDVGERSVGKVVIYNLTGRTITLKKGTTVLTAGGKSYYFREDQNLVKPISPRVVNDPNAKLPTAVEVEAGSGGEGFNLPAGARLEISNQVFGSKPQSLYAKAATAIEGGNSRFVSQISDADLGRAKIQLALSVAQDIQREISPNHELILDKAYEYQVVDLKTNQDVGTETPTFEATGTVVFKGIKFSALDVQDIIRTAFSDDIPDGFQLQDVSKDDMDLRTIMVDVTKGYLKVHVNFNSEAVAKVDLDGVESRLRAKKVADASEVLLGMPGVEKVKFNTTPPWQGWLPLLATRIHIKISTEMNNEE